MTRRGQMWYLDFIISLLIFGTAMYLLFGTLAEQGQNTDNLNDLTIASMRASSRLISEGVPRNWSTEDVVIPGILAENYNFSQQKWDQLAAIAMSDPTKFKRLLTLTQQPYLVIENSEDVTIMSMGTPPTEAKHVSQVTRIVMLNESIARLVVRTWS